MIDLNLQHTNLQSVLAGLSMNGRPKRITQCTFLCYTVNCTYSIRFQSPGDWFDTSNRKEKSLRHVAMIAKS